MWVKQQLQYDYQRELQISQWVQAQKSSVFKTGLNRQVQPGTNSKSGLAEEKKWKLYKPVETSFNRESIYLCKLGSQLDGYFSSTLSLKEYHNSSYYPPFMCAIFCFFKDFSN